MKRMLVQFLVIYIFFPPTVNVYAANSQELAKQRQAAQQDRQKQKNERIRHINDATLSFRDFTRNLKADYRERIKALDVEFELRQVELQAEHKSRVASAEAEYQKKLSSLFSKPGVEFTEQQIQALQKESKAYADELFALKRNSADAVQAERMTNEEKKHTLLAEMDRAALQEAKTLGLTEKYSPILATPIGGELTRPEQRWNERERKEVVRLQDRNNATLREFRNGAELRAWEMRNKNEDFKLKWEKNAKLHALDSDQMFLNTLFIQAAQGKQFDQQKFMAQVAELNEKKKQVNIEYRKIRDKNRIMRREEKKSILAK